MIPSIGTLVAAYIAFRIIEILAQGKSRHPSDWGLAITVIAGAIALLVIVAFWVNLMAAGVSVHDSLSRMP